MLIPTEYRDRAEAGQVLASQLSAHFAQRELVVLGLPRGGVPVAYEVARALHAPLDVFLVRKLGVPGAEEFAFGAIASGGVRVVNQSSISHLPGPQRVLAAVTARERAELERSEIAYRAHSPALDLRGQTVILVDDGLATGASMRAAIKAVRQREVAGVVAAVPVGSPEACASLAREVDELVCPLAPPQFQAVGQFYEDFEPTSDEEVRDLLAKAAGRSSL